MFLVKFLNEEEIIKFFEHLRYQGLTAILIEDVMPQNLTNQIPYECLIIDSDGFEIKRTNK